VCNVQCSHIWENANDQKHTCDICNFVENHQLNAVTGKCDKCGY